MRIWRSKYVWSMEKGKKTSRSQSMCWRPNSILWKNQSVRFVKPEHQIFTVVRWTIFLNGGQLYIFHKLDHIGMFFKFCTSFSDNLVEFYSRNKEVLETTRRWSRTEFLKHPWWNPCWDNQNGYMECMIWSSDKEAMAFWKCSSCKTGGSSLGNRRVRFSQIRPESK
jgi:hypothetical protein